MAMGGDTTGAAATGSGSDGGRRLDGAVVEEDEEYYDAEEIAAGLIAPPADDPTFPGDPRPTPVADGGDSGDADSVYADAVGDEEGDFARRLIGGQGASTAADTATGGQEPPPQEPPLATTIPGYTGNAEEPVTDGQKPLDKKHTEDGDLDAASRFLNMLKRQRHTLLGIAQSRAGRSEQVQKQC
eukprot:jgi/Mesvir1/18517/Mv03583-RA.1